MRRRLIPVAVAAALAVAGGCSGGGDETAAEGAPAVATATATAPAATATAPAATVTSAPAPAATVGVPPVPAGGTQQIPGIVARVVPSTVAVLVEGVAGSGEGSGVVWGDGLIVTNNHVVEGASRVVVALASGERIPAEVRATDPRTDLALLEVAREDLPPATFADRVPVVGELAVAIGNPLGFESSVTAGIVSGRDRVLEAPGDGRLVGLLQTDAAISPGNSGGALVDAAGEVIGVNVAYIPPQARAVSIGFAIPSSTVIDVVGELLEDGRADHASLGVQLAQVADGLGPEEGAAVVAVFPGTAAAEAGLRPGDLIVSLDGRPVRSFNDLVTALRPLSPGQRVRIEVVRDGARRTLEAELDASP